MVAQPAAALSTLRQRLTAHLHTGQETCPLCDQVIPPEKLEEISGRIAAREREETLAITAKLEQQYALDKAQVEAKGHADLELERQQSAEREAAVRQAERQAAAAALAETLAEAERGRQELQDNLRQQVAEAEAARTAAEQAGVTLQTQLDELQKTKNAELAKVKEDAAAAALRTRQEATEAAEAALHGQIAEKDEAIAAAQARTVEAEGKLDALAAQQELTLKQQLDAQREVLEKDKDEALNAEKARAFDETQKLQNKLNEMQRALEKKTADELGEGAEVNLFEALKDEFREDCIERITKGTPGADVHHVVLYNGRECGIIVYDSKNHGQYPSDHVTKLRADQLAAKADHAILSTRKAKTGQLHIEGGVLLANPARVVMLVKLLRQHMIQIHSMRMSSVAREEKTAALYDFITSERCGQFLSRIDANAQGLLDLQVKAKKFHDKAWEKEGELIRQIQKSQGDLSNEICHIIGTAADEIQDLEASEL